MIGGKLRLKGMKPVAKAAPVIKRPKIEEKEEKVEEAPPKIQEGEGKIISSQTVIHGSKTNFDKVLAPGDLLIVKVGEKYVQRKITMVLGRKSMCISEPFSEDLTVKTSFSFFKLAKPEAKIIEEDP